MTDQPNNPPAFPKTGYYHKDNDSVFDSKNQDGITALDYFAAKAMQGMLASPALLEVVTAGNITNGTYAERVAKKSFEMAQAMLAERSKHVK